MLAAQSGWTLCDPMDCSPPYNMFYVTDTDRICHAVIHASEESKAARGGRGEASVSTVLSEVGDGLPWAAPRRK